MAFKFLRMVITDIALPPLLILGKRYRLIAYSQSNIGNVNHQDIKTNTANIYFVKTPSRHHDGHVIWGRLLVRRRQVSLRLVRSQRLTWAHNLWDSCQDGHRVQTPVPWSPLLSSLTQPATVIMSDVSSSENCWFSPSRTPEQKKMRGKTDFWEFG